MINVTLRTKINANNMFSLYLDYYPAIIFPKTGKASRREFLKLKIYQIPQSEIQKSHNKETLYLAETIRAKRILQLRNKEYGFKENISLDVNFIVFYKSMVEEFYNRESKSNYNSWKSSLNYFIEFTGDKLTTNQLTSLHVHNFRTFLLKTTNLRTGKGKLANNTASSYYKNFIAVLKKAHQQHLLSSNLALEAVYIKEAETHREYLTEEELSRLWITPLKLEKIKHLALFSAFTGLRISDIIGLRWENLYADIHQGNYIKLKEQKTGNINNHPISETAYKILKLQETKTGFVFQDIKYSQIPRRLKKWIKDAGITKKITFHNFRHSYATLQLANGTDIYTVSKLLGHKNLATTQIYTKVMDKNKIEAVNRINIKLDGLS